MMQGPSMDDMRKFMSYDTDQSQSINWTEFLAAQPPDIRRQYSDAQIRAWFDAADSNGDGVIDANEFFALQGIPVGQRARPAPKPASSFDGCHVESRRSMEAMREFMRYDTDQSMQLDWKKFLAMQPAEIRASYTEAEIRAWFDAADTDGNGFIGPNEYFALCGY